MGAIRTYILLKRIIGIANLYFNGVGFCFVPGASGVIEYNRDWEPKDNCKKATEIISYC